MEFLDTLKLGFGHSLIMGHTPEKITDVMLIEKFNKEIHKNEDLERFGLFDSNQSNYNTYYPDVTAEDLAPKDSEFIEPTFRALSEVIVHKEFNPVDFSMNSVLRKSMSLLTGASVNVDHETSVGNAIGAVKSVAWQESYKTDSGIQVPAGINSKLKIDGKSNPKTARGIMMDPPSIHSTSVTVQFLWEKSHANLSEAEFFNGLATFDKDGKLIRRIATKVKRYHEISLVSHGADPYAQLVRDLKIVNPKWGDISYNSMTGEHKHHQKYFFYDYQTDVINNSIPKESNNNSPLTNTSIMKREHLIILAALMGITLPATSGTENVELTEAEQTQIQNKITEMVNLNNTNATTLGANQTEITRLLAIETAYNTESATFAEAVALKAFKDTATKTLRDRVMLAYKKVEGDKALPAIIGLIETGDFAALQALEIQYTQQLDAKYPSTCGDCGSTKVTRASAKLKEGDESEIKDAGSFRDNLKKRANQANNKTIGAPHEKLEKASK